VHSSTVTVLSNSVVSHANDQQPGRNDAVVSTVVEEVGRQPLDLKQGRGGQRGGRGEQDTGDVVDVVDVRSWLKENTSMFLRPW